MESTDNHSLPADIVSNILLRHSVKTLTQFQCVCKSWSSLISSPQFQNNHFRQAQRNPLLLILQSVQISNNGLTFAFSSYNKNKETLVKKFSKRTNMLPYILLGMLYEYMTHCQGLVCISTLQSRPILVCNPSREEMVCLPHTEGVTFCIGFGYAASTEQFKVVRFFFDQMDKSYCEVFTLGTSHWRKARTPPPYLINSGTSPFVHGSLHFLPLNHDRAGVKDSDYIAAFNIETEDYKRIVLPKYYYSLAGSHIANKKKFMHLSNLGGILCLTLSFGEAIRLELWLLKDYANVDWAKGYSIDLSSVIRNPSYYFGAYLIDNVADDSILLECRDNNDVKILSYNPKDGIITERKEKACAATIYVETFYPLRGT